MQSVVIATFDGTDKAENVYLSLLESYPSERGAPKEAVIAVVDPDRQVHLTPVNRPAVPTAIGGGFVGALAGLMLFNPVLAVVGGIAGGGAGAIWGALKEVGIDEPFMERLTAQLKPESSALFVRVREDQAAKIVDLLQPQADRTLQTVLAHDDEERLRTVLQVSQRGREK
jgi:uncharacterized membrane protein